MTNLCAICRRYQLHMSPVNESLCVSCYEESQVMRVRAREVPDKALTLSEVASWFQTGQRPRSWRAAWEAK